MKNFVYMGAALLALVSTPAVFAQSYSHDVANLLREIEYGRPLSEYRKAVGGDVEARLAFSESLRSLSKKNSFSEKHEHLDYRYWLSTVPKDELVEWAVEVGFKKLTCGWVGGYCRGQDADYFLSIAAEAGSNAGKVGMGIFAWLGGSDSKAVRNEAVWWWEDAYDNGVDYSLLETIAEQWWLKVGKIPGAEHEVIKWLQRAQERGSPNAGLLIAYRRATIPTLDMEAQDFKLLNDADYHVLENIASQWLDQAGEVPGAEHEAIKWLQRAQERGSPNAELYIALWRATTPALDMKEQGFEDLIKLANNNNAEAAYQLGLIYDNGVNTDVDPEQAMQWFQKGWDLGHYDAFIHAVKNLMKGSEEDQKRAFRALEPLIRRDPRALFYVAIMYRDGIGTDIDEEQALSYFELLASRDYPEAKMHAEALKGRMNGKQ